MSDNAQLRTESRFESTTIWWEAPPDSRREQARARNDALVLRLAERPGQWARLPMEGKEGAAVAKAIARRGVEYRGRTAGDTVHWWVRWPKSRSGPEGEGR